MCQLRVFSALVVLATAPRSQELLRGWIPPNAPPPAELTGLVYDEARQRLVLYGGRQGGSFRDVFEWGGSAWVRRAPDDLPARV